MGQSPHSFVVERLGILLLTRVQYIGYSSGGHGESEKGPGDMAYPLLPAEFYRPIRF